MRRPAPPAGLTALACVAAGGAVGTFARVVVSELAPPALTVTMAINVVGAFALGVVLTALPEGGALGGARGGARVHEGRRQRRRHHARLLLGPGFCGGFTTYSLIALQVSTLARAGDGVGAMAYPAATLVLGGAATVLGTALGSRRHDGG